MLDFQLNTPKEIWDAKKILYESDSSTKRSFMISLTAGGLLLLLLLFSFVGTGDSWKCTIDSKANKKKEFICSEVRRIANCKTITGPIHSEVFLTIDSDVKASAEIQCPWEIAISELRFCFTLLSLMCVLVGIYALNKESKKFAELHFHSGLFLSVLLFISTFFDYLAISNSNTNNYNFCNLQDEFEVEKGVTGEMKCSFGFYYTTVVIELLCSVALATSAKAIDTWKTHHVVDSL